MQKEGFQGFCSVWASISCTLSRDLFTWHSRVLSDHHQCERQFRLPGSHPQGVSDKPTTPNLVVRPCWAKVCRCRGWWVRDSNPICTDGIEPRRTLEKHQTNQTSCRAAVAVASVHSLRWSSSPRGRTASHARWLRLKAQSRKRNISQINPVQAVRARLQVMRPTASASIGEPSISPPRTAGMRLTIPER